MIHHQTPSQTASAFLSKSIAAGCSQEQINAIGRLLQVLKSTSSPWLFATDGLVEPSPSSPWITIWRATDNRVGHETLVVEIDGDGDAIFTNGDDDQAEGTWASLGADDDDVLETLDEAWSNMFGL